MHLKTVFVAISLVSLTWGARYARFEVGYGLGPQYSRVEPEHILHGETTPSRTIELNVEFENEFESHPQVGIAAASLAWEQGDNGFGARVSEVSRKGFLVSIQARADRQVFQYKFNWFATDDPRVRVLYWSTEDTEALVEEGNEQVFPIRFGLKDRQWAGVVPDVSVFTIGGGFSGASNVNRFKITDVTSEGIDLTYTTDTGSERNYIAACFVLSYENALWSVGQLDYEVEEGSPFLERESDSELVSVEINITLDKHDNPPKGPHFYGLTSFETSAEMDSYFEIENPVIGDEEHTFTLVARDQTKLQLISFEYFVYDGRNGVVHDQKCAELFSECQFEGASYRLCGHLENFANNAFSGPVKSYTVPRNKVVHLVNSNGQVQALQGINSCVEDVFKASQYGDSDSDSEDTSFSVSAEEAITFQTEEDGYLQSEESGYPTSDPTLQSEEADTTLLSEEGALQLLGKGFVHYSSEEWVGESAEEGQFVLASEESAGGEGFAEEQVGDETGYAASEEAYPIQYASEEGLTYPEEALTYAEEGLTYAEEGLTYAEEGPVYTPEEGSAVEYASEESLVIYQSSEEVEFTSEGGYESEYDYFSEDYASEYTSEEDQEPVVVSDVEFYQLRQVA